MYNMIPLFIIIVTILDLDYGYYYCVAMTTGLPPFKNTVDITVELIQLPLDRIIISRNKYKKKQEREETIENNTHRHPHGRPGRGVDEGRADEELLGLNEE